MAKILGVFFAAFFVVFALDQAVKQIFLGGFSWQGEYFSLVLAYNRGVAFSMFAFLGQWLKFIQLALIAGVCGYLLWRLKRKFDARAAAKTTPNSSSNSDSNLSSSNGKNIEKKEILEEHALGAGVILGAGSSNLLDRFVHGGVVDYVYWHKWFEFAIFNLADVMIDVGVVLILWQSFAAGRKRGEKGAKNGR